MIDGQLHISRPRATDYLLCKGLHPPIISKETFNIAQDLMRHNPARPIGRKKYSKKLIEQALLYVVIADGIWLGDRIQNTPIC